MAQDFTAELLEKAKQQGQIPSDIPLDLAAFFVNTLTTDLGKFLASRVGVESQDLLKPDNLKRAVHEVDLEGLVDHLMHLMKDGLSPKREV